MNDLKTDKPTLAQSLRRYGSDFISHAASRGIEDIEAAGELMLEAARVLAEPPAEQEPVYGDVLPPVGSRVYIRHGRDDDAHACTVTGYYAWADLGGSNLLHRVFVRLVYEGTTVQQARLLRDCYPTAEAALTAAPEAPQPAKRESLTDVEILHALMLSPPEPSLWPHLKDEAVVGDVQRAVIAISRAIIAAYEAKNGTTKERHDG